MSTCAYGRCMGGVPLAPFGWSRRSHVLRMDVERVYGAPHDGVKGPHRREPCQGRVRKRSARAPVAPVTRPVRAALRPRADGALEARGAVELALAGARLQARVGAGGIDELMVWGSGRGASLRFEPALEPTALEVTPNRWHAVWAGGSLTVSASLRWPALLLRGSGSLPRLRLVRPRRAPPGFAAAPVRVPLADGQGVASAWCHTLLRVAEGTVERGGRVAFGPSGLAVLAGGEDAAEAAAAAAWVLADPAALERELDAYHARLRAAFWVADAELQSLALHGLHAAFGARRALADGRFAGFAAGVGYALPARSYYRDAYWTLQALLPLEPAAVRAQLLLLARGVHPNGEAPSGVVIASSAGERSWRAQRAADPALARDHPRDGEWWADHVDSPLFFVLLASEVAAWCGEPDLLAREVDGVTLGARVAAILERVHATRDAAGLPRKPHHDRDWADNVVRGGAVTYQAGLYHGALMGAAALVEAGDPERAARYRRRAVALRAGARARLWRDDLGHFVAFREPSGRAETHLAIETLTALRYGLADDAQASSVLAAMRARLETRHNADQPYGDWGVMCVHPPYAAWVPRRAKSRFAYRYHDGADWPYWDGVYAQERLRRALPGWRYPLTRWWTYGLERGWATPVEYYSPPFAPGSPSNAWSAMPAAAMLLGGFGLSHDGGARVPPWGESGATRSLPDGGVQRVRVRNGHLEVEHDGRPVA